MLLFQQRESRFQRHHGFRRVSARILRELRTTHFGMRGKARGVELSVARVLVVACRACCSSHVGGVHAEFRSSDPMIGLLLATALQ
jgi:hypothetical protein